MVEMDTSAAYFNARIRAKRSRLLTNAELDALLAKDSLKGVVDSLMGTVYEEELAESLTRYEGADAVEDGVSRNLVNTFYRIDRMAQAEFKPFVHVFLMRWDLMAVKGLLRNCHHGLTGGRGKDSLFPGPTMTVALMEELGKYGSMEALVEGLMGWNHRLCRGLVKEMDVYRTDRDLTALEEALDRSYFVTNARRLRQFTDDNSLLLRRMLRMEIDRINLRNLLHVRDPQMEGNWLTSRLLPEGTLSEQTLKDMVGASNPERALDVLRTTVYGDMVEELGPSIGAGRLSGLDRQLEMLFIDRLRRASLSNVFGIGLLMRYAWQKYNEVMNIRLIVRGKARGIPSERIQEEMMYA